MLIRSLSVTCGCHVRNVNRIFLRGLYVEIILCQAGMMRRESSPLEHQQNGLVERVVRTMEEQVASIRDSDDMEYIHSIGFSSEVRKSLESSFLSAVL